MTLGQGATARTLDALPATYLDVAPGVAEAVYELEVDHAALAKALAEADL